MPISADGVLNQLRTYANENELSSVLLSRLDEQLTYGNSPKYTSEEAQIRHELDISYKNLQNTKTKLEHSEIHRKNYEQKLNSIINAIREFTSDTTFHQILVSSGA